MTQAQLERAICRATGETRSVIRRVGFQFMPAPRIVLPPRHLPRSAAQRQKSIAR